jgi:transposase-like protein
MPNDTRTLIHEQIPTWENLEAFARGKVQQFVQHILEEEVTELLGRARSERRAPVDAPAGYRNGLGKPRRLATLGGTITLRRPRLRGLEERFESRILPLFRRRTKELGQLLPELYLHGLSLGDFELALRGLLGEGAPLSPASIARLKATWQLEYEAWKKRDLAGRELVHVWADGVYVKAGLEKERACLLVVIGAFRDGHKELLALVSGYRESTESWLAVLRDLKARGLGAPVLAVADGAMAFWAAAAQVWPETRHQRCWNHALVNVMDKLPKGKQRAAKLLLCAMPQAPTRAEAARLRDGFIRRYRSSYPEAVVILETDWETLTTFYDFPEEHWKHLRTSNPVESPFAALRLRTGAAKRFKVVANATMLIWRVLRVVERRFRKLDAPELLKDVYEGRTFVHGKPITPVIRKEAT